MVSLCDSEKQFQNAMFIETLLLGLILRTKTNVLDVCVLSKYFLTEVC